MKRVLILLCCVCLIICLAAPALAVTVNWQDYVVSTTQGVEYDTNDVFIPASVSNSSWSSSGLTDAVVSGSSIQFSYDDDHSSYHAITLALNDLRINLANINLQDSLDVYFSLNGFPDDTFKIKFTTKYYDADFSVISNVYGQWEDADGSGSYVLPVDLSAKPEDALYVSFVFEVYVNYLPAGDYSIEYVGLGFDVLTPGTMPKPSPITIHPQDYIANESSNGDTSTLYVSVPSSDLDILWNTLRNDDFSVLSQLYGNPYKVTMDCIEYDYWIGCQVFDKLDITDIVNGSTLNVKFDIDVDDLDVSTEQPFPSAIRYQVRYYDSNGVMLDTVKFYTVPDADFFTETSLDVTIDKPDGAVSMTFIVQFMDISVDHEPFEFTLDLNSVNFICDIPTMVRVQQETGRTNELLNEAINGNHGFDSSGSNFGSEADQLAGANDQMNDAMSSGMNSLGTMVNSAAFASTLTTLGSALSAVFEGHEVTICGVSGNPFTLLVTIFAIAILLPLGLKFIFRKWGSGGD